MFSGLRLFFITLALTVIGSAAYAYASAASNDITASGEGASAISGWAITNVHYQLGSDAISLAGVEFDTERPAGMIKVKLISTQADFYTCSHQNANHWHCATPGVLIAEVNELRVVAAE